MPDTLPGNCTPYRIRAGAGERYAFSGQLAAVIARPNDTSGLLEAAIVSGGRGPGFPAHRHPHGHEVVLVLDGQLELALGGRVCTLNRGDFASLPPGTSHAYTMRGHHTRFLHWMVGGALTEAYRGLATATDAIAHDEHGAGVVDVARLSALGARADLQLDHAPASSDRLAGVTRAPGNGSAYVLESGEGERLLAGDQLFAFLATQADTKGAFIALSTVGPAGDRIPNHFHEKHTETFFCMDGRMTMWADGVELELLPGDFLHVPARAIHSYRLDAPYTRFVGLLSPGLFEPFFRAMCEPFDGYIFPATPGPVRFDRVMQRLHELDLKLVDPPRPPAGHPHGS